jgi:hypothetical protein
LGCLPTSKSSLPCITNESLRFWKASRLRIMLSLLI